jgi:hypothetical protein
MTGILSRTADRMTSIFGRAADRMTGVLRGISPDYA